MEVLTIAKKNIRMLFRNVLFIIFLIVIPIVMVFFIDMIMDNAVVTNDSHSFVETVILKQNNNFTQTYTTGILVQFMLIASVLAASMVVTERENNTLMRMFIAPISKLKIIFGMLIGHSVFVTIIASLIIGLTSILFGIDWGDSWINIIIVTVFAVYVATSLSFIVSGIFKNGKVAGSVMSIIVVIMTFLSGSMVQDDKFNVISKFTINKWISDAYLKLMSGGTLESIRTNIFILVIMGTFFMLIASILYRKENIYE